MIPLISGELDGHCFPSRKIEDLWSFFLFWATPGWVVIQYIRSTAFVFLFNKQYCDQEKSNCRCFGDRENGIYFTRTGKVRPTFDGNRRIKIIMGNREHKITNFRWGGGGRGTRPFISGDHGDTYPHRFGRASRMYRLLNTSKHNKYEPVHEISYNNNTIWRF